MPKILFIVQYPKGISPSQRFRIEIYEELLTQNGFEFNTEYFIDNNTKSILFKRGHTLKKIIGTLKGFFRRVGGLFVIRKYDYIFVQREASPVGPPIFEWIYIKLFRKKVIYDFDDSIWVPAISRGNEWTRLVKSFWKVRYICKWAYKVSVGNKFLYDFAFRYNSNVVLNPTCVDVCGMHNQLKDQNTQNIVIGWTGSTTTLPYLNGILDILIELQSKYSFTFIVISDTDPHLQLKNYKFIPWNKDHEIEDLLKCNIGIMPLIEFENGEGQILSHAEGKCGFKIIQYSALGIPSVASPVGVNSTIISDKIDGFLCSNPEEWMSALELLIVNADLRSKMGEMINKKIINNFSLQSNTANFMSLFN